MNAKVMAVVVTAVGLALVGAGGCGAAGGPRPPMGKVHGKVMYNGKPLSKGSVTFVPIQGKGGETGQSATGTIESDGSFDLTTFNTGDGAITGQHAVIVQAREESAPPPQATGPGAMVGQMPEFGGPNAYKPPKTLVPDKYTKVESTPLKYTVEPGSNDFTLDLKD